MSPDKRRDELHGGNFREWGLHSLLYQTGFPDRNIFPRGPTLCFMGCLKPRELWLHLCPKQDVAGRSLLWHKMLHSLINNLTHALINFLLCFFFQIQKFLQKPITELLESETNVLRDRACSQRARVRSACSCSNTTLFPHGGQECSHVSPHHCRRRWSRSLRRGVGDREKGEIPTSSITQRRVCPLPRIYARVCHQPAIARGSGSAPEVHRFCICSRQPSFRMI